MKINLHCLSFLSFIKKNHKIPTYHWSKTIESGEKISWWNKCFHYFMLATIIGTQLLQRPFPRVTALSFLLKCLKSLENTWQEIRDRFLHTESPQILQIHSSILVLIFSLPHSFSVGFRSEDRDSHGKRFILCSVTHFCVYFDVCFGLLSCWKIKTAPIIRFLTEAVRFLFFICWYLIESMMLCIWTRCPGPPAEKQAHNIKDPAVYLTVDMGYFFYLCLY